MLIERIDKTKQDKIRISPCHANRASELGHVCDRRLVWLRTRWSEQVPYDLGLQYIFDEGRAQERVVVRTIEEAGFEVVRQQVAVEWPTYEITGHPDLALAYDQELDVQIRDRIRHKPDADLFPVPIEIKSMAPHLWTSITDLKSMVTHAKWWIRKYHSQLVLYCWMESRPVGLFILKNKSNGRLKEVLVELADPDMLDITTALLNRAQRVNDFIRAGEIPAVPSGIDLDVCQGCSFYRLDECLTARTLGDGASLEIDPSWAEAVDRREALRDAADEFSRLDKSLKKRYHAKSMFVGDYLVTGNWRKKTSGRCTAGKDCPSYEQTVLEHGSWVSKIVPLGGSSSHTTKEGADEVL